MSWFVWHIARLRLFDCAGRGVGLLGLVCLSLIAFSQGALRAGESAILTPAPKPRICRRTKSKSPAS